MTNLGVYISSLDEERLIGTCITHIKKWFPQVELIDLGSRDDTINIAESLDIPVNKYDSISGTDWTILKNETALKHDWIFWVDGDEIYPDRTLRLIKNLIGNTVHESIRVSWALVKEENGLKYVTSPKINGLKVYNSSVFKFKRSWPREVLYSLDPKVEPEEKFLYNGIWCWHGVLLERSSVEERKERKVKRMKKIEEYGILDWAIIERLPWE